MYAQNIFEKRCNLIANFDFFRGCSEKLLLEVAELMKEQQFKKNTHIMRQGDRSQTLYIIVSGRAKVFINNEEGDQTVLSLLSQGDYFGELSLFDDCPRSASVYTTENTTVLSLNQTDFREIFNKYPELRKPIFKALTSRVREADEIICSLTSKNIYDRLLYRLHREAKVRVDGSLVTPKLTHQDLADMIGASREMVSRVLRQLKVDGLIEVNQKRITLLDKQVIIKRVV